MSTPHVTPITIVAFNTATESENKIHDDEVASKLGFTGGLVPGVDVYAYGLAPAIRHWGERFLHHGTASVRLAAPVFDGESIEVVAELRSATEMTATVESPTGRCASLTMTVPAEDEAGPTAPSPITRWRDKGPDERPPASPEAFDQQPILASYTISQSADAARQYVADVRASSLTTDLGVTHPGWLLRQANDVLAQTVVLGPWIHVGSEVTHYRAALIGEPLKVQATIDRHYEHKGHRFVVHDMEILDADDQVVCAVHHTAIYEPRQLRVG